MTAAAVLPRKAISPKERELMVSEYLSGTSTKRIARETGRSRASISAALKRAGVEMRTFRQASTEEIAEMRALHSAGMPLVHIAKRLSYSEKTIWNHLKTQR